MGCRCRVPVPRIVEKERNSDGEDGHPSIATGAKKRLEKRIGCEMIAIDTPRLLNRGGTIARDRLALEGAS